MNNFTMILDIDDCYPNPCENGGSCSDGIGTYNCTCISEFTGANCQGNNLHRATLPE